MNKSHLLSIHGKSDFWRKSNLLFIQQKRTIIPALVGLGMAIVVGSTVGVYASRALKRMNEENHQTININEESNNSSVKYTSKTTGELTNMSGIDIGSTNAKLAFCERNNINIIETPDGKRSTPSIIHYSLNEEAIIGNIAKSVRFQKQKRTFSYVPLLVGLAESDAYFQKLMKLNIFPVAFVDNPDSIYASIASEIFKHASNKVKNFNRYPLVVTVPNYFSKEHSDNVIKVLRNSSINCVGTVFDGEAAFLGSKVLVEKFVPINNSNSLVIDVGGRLTQLSIVGFSNSKPKLRFHETLFDVCGESFDDELARYISESFAKENYQMNLMLDPIAKQRIYDAAELAKVDLSKSLSTSVNIPFITADQYGPKHLQITITRATFYNLIQQRLDTFTRAISKLLDDHKVDHILLVGGSARIPKIQQEIEKISEIRIIYADTPEEAMAIGAAAYMKEI